MSTPSKHSPNRVGIRNTSDYSPFGVELDGRTVSVDGYRFGYNTQENTDEIAGKGNHTTALYWEYNSRLAYRWNRDPKIIPTISDYSINSRNPIFYMDPNGDFNKKFGANVYKFFHGGEVAQAEVGPHKGEWYVKERIENNQIISSKRTAFNEQTIDPTKVSMDVSWGWSKESEKKRNNFYKNVSSVTNPLSFAQGHKQFLIESQIASRRNVKIKNLNISHFDELGDWGSKIMYGSKIVNHALGGAGIILNVGDAAENGLEGHHISDITIDGLIIATGTVCPVAGIIVGSAYFLGDLGFQYFHDGKSISEYYFD
jgi:hypothetical protein